MVGRLFFETLFPLFYFLPLGDRDKQTGSTNKVFNDFLVLCFFTTNLSPSFGNFCCLLMNLILLSFLWNAPASSGRLIELCRLLTPRFVLFFKYLCKSCWDRFWLRCRTSFRGFLPPSLPSCKLVRLLALVPSLWFNRPSRSCGVETSKELRPSSWTSSTLLSSFIVRLMDGVCCLNLFLIRAPLITWSLASTKLELPC